MFLHRAFTVVTLLLLVPLGRAADVEPYLPKDTETVLNINVRQLLDSELVKNHFLETAQEALRGNDEIQDVLKDLGFDPFTDLDRVVIAAPLGTEKDRGLVIVHGRFDVAKFRAKAKEVAKDQSDYLKIHKILGDHLLYEVNHPELDDPVFVAIPSDDTLLASAGKDYVVNALKKKIGKKTKAALKNEKFQGLLEKIDARQTLSLAAVTNSEVAKVIDKAPGDIKSMIEKIQAVAGGLTINDEIKLEVAVTTKNAKDAKDLSDSAKAGLNLILGFAAPLAQNKDNQKVELLVDVIKSLRITSKAETVFVKARISSDLIEDAIKQKGK